ncbi:PLP-dependent aminotransferase family protein [Streptococcus iniae]|uniref:GntR family transcriptional regulator n=1 Tax=Streptococcus iniae TaxID=1346 RepID=A0A3L8GHE8_STRIN|nr:aminotransferase class I/II-fold pyridoxal phosphate-dependent enzyme [Streptococcus iniae]AGM98780.1 bacterial regulatory protein, GntR family [Streptococcus iniae SF1]AHY15744.1 GntR family transcriptional regulator [Streptococcus iniae]AHY17612.1 GntR family transcriptional regulator [Streptococcus iniae]AJG25907.1 GntR family transcriptional regulator [Streptococcus iniae]APD31783.1 GntR family transcriptional regulator [Streptococcus iniae]
MLNKYQQIINDITQSITEETLVKGDKVPSIRSLSQTYHCSKDTVQRALLDLKYQGLVYAVPKSGYYILGKQENTNSYLSPFKNHHKQAYEDFRLCLNDSLSQQESYLFDYYYKNQGLDDLIDSLLSYFAEIAVYANKEDIIITSGTQQALYILSQMTFPNAKDCILLESPTYHRMEDLVKSLGLPFKRIDRSFNGIDLEVLEKIFKAGDIKFFYTISRFSNPLGLSYRNEEKEKIIALANQYDVYIIEDDFLGEFAKSNNTPLHYFDINQRVIYLKSFSVSVFPSLRIGALVLPKALQEPFLTHKSMIDLDTNLIMQKALSLYLANGMFDKNLKQHRHIFQTMLQKTEKYLQKELGLDDYTVTPQFLTLRYDSKNCDWDLKHLKKHQLLRHKKSSYLQIELKENTLDFLRSLHTKAKNRN